MATLKIPKGKTYTFSITVLEKNSYLPKDLANMDMTNSSFSLVKLDTLAPVVGTITLTRIPDTKILITDPDTYLNGKVSVSIPDTVTGDLVFERGDKVDGYYGKPTYEGVISIVFTNSTSSIVTVLTDIVVVPLGI
jgi:hypothetical protein